MINFFFCKMIICEMKSLVKSTFVNKSFVFLKKTVTSQSLKITKILKFNKTLYNLKKFSYLWQKHLTKTFANMKFESMFQKICIMIRNNLIIFYFVNDIVLCFRQRNQFIIDKIIIDLINRYIMKMIKKLK